MQKHSPNLVVHPPNARAVVDAEFEVAWLRTVPGNKPCRAIAKYWFRNGRDLGLAARAAEERATVKELRERLAELADVAELERKVRRMSEALAELHYCARQLRSAERSRNNIKNETVRVDAAISNAGKLLADYSTKVRT